MEHERSFSKILIICDRDRKTTEEIENSFVPNALSLRFRQKGWVKNDCLDGYRVPLFNRDGTDHSSLRGRRYIGKRRAGLSRGECGGDKPLIDSCIAFVEENKGKAKRYLTKKRLVEKAKLGVAFAMISLEKVFDFIDEILRGIDWGKKESLVKALQRLQEI